MLTSYVLSIATAAGLDLPERVQAGMEEALRRFVSGTLATTPPLPTADLALRKLAALEALSRVGAVEPALHEQHHHRADALADLGGDRLVEPPAPDRAAVPTRRQFAEVEQLLRARLNGRRHDASASRPRTATISVWLMSDPDVNAVRLVLALVEHGAWRDDLPRLVRGALGRQQRGAWSTTVANAWGTLAVEKFAAAFEAAPVTGATHATLVRRGRGSSTGTRDAGGRERRAALAAHGQRRSRRSRTPAPDARGRRSRPAPRCRCRRRSSPAIASPRR